MIGATDITGGVDAQLQRGDPRMATAVPDHLDPEDAARIAAGDHIVDILIEERAPKMRASKLWPLYKAVLYPLLKEPRAKRMADDLMGLSGFEAMNTVADALDLDLSVNGLENVPAEGRILIAPNHPTGIADGIAMHEALKVRRPDACFFANRDAVRVSRRFGEVIIPVEWVEEKRTRQRSRETLVETKKAFEGERCIVLFQSGRLAFMDENKVLTEQEWMASIAIFARKYKCDVVPAHVKARNSWLYYWFRNLSPELRDITLFNELLNKRGKKFEITFGAKIPYTALEGEPADVAAELRRHTIEDVRKKVGWRPIGA